MEKLEINVRAKPPFNPLLLTSIEDMKARLLDGDVIEFLSKWSGNWYAPEVGSLLSDMYLDSINDQIKQNGVRVNPDLKYVFSRTAVFKFEGDGEKISPVQRTTLEKVQAVEKWASFIRWANSMNQITVPKDTYVPHF